MSDQNKKLEQQLALCQADLERMQKAISPEDACSEVADFIKGQQDPFGAGMEGNNPWLSAPDGGGGCCSTM